MVFGGRQGFDDYHALFTGDVGPKGLIESALYAFERGMLRPPHLFQIPHQGSRHNVTPTALNLWLGQHRQESDPLVGWAACSVGSNKMSHPRKTVTNALLRRGYKTQIARDGVLCYSNKMRDGWYTAPAVQFNTYVEEAA
jgi:beta-lactamase superfamily II metal-dependent hydrolase